MRFGIISAGKGSRLASEGFGEPKPLVPINGVPMIERLARIMMRCGADRIAVIVNADNPAVADFVSGLARELPIDLTVKSTPTPMHSLMELAPNLGSDRFCVTTVDTVFRESCFSSMMDEFAHTPYDGVMGVTQLVDDEKPLYVDVDDQMNITAFRDRPWKDARYVSGGVYAMTDKAFPVLDDCIERGISRMRNFQRALVDAGLHLRAYSIDKIVDVDHAADIATAEMFLRGGE